MKIKNIPQYWRNKAEKTAKSGGRLYLVGGAVRDSLMDKAPKDLDFCIVGLSMQKFKEIFPEAELVGKDFPVFICNGEEVAFARKEWSTEVTRILKAE